MGSTVVWLGGHPSPQSSEIVMPLSIKDQKSKQKTNKQTKNSDCFALVYRR
jgi:hypothetical protein